ncbi:hypothetical protein BY996DRAFT_6761113 [Phakopsora pachyrhizi]|nr:hypothetical protein BY996DRAFT_6761113 [Phakopsora pachyrhizi]
MFVTWAAEAVMALRCWNVWLRNNSIGILMIILMLSEISVMSLMAIKRLSDKEYFVVVDGAVSCIPMGKSFGIRWIIMLSTPVIVTALIFIISAIGILRVRQTVGNSAFLSKLAKDGLLYVGLSLTIYSTTLIAFITGGNILKASGSSISFLRTSLIHSHHVFSNTHVYTSYFVRIKKK